MNDIIEVTNLVKKYGNISAIDNISFNVKKGSLFSFLGPNGAGKSTTINILTSFLEKTSGHIKILGFELGKDNKKIREKIGVVFQESILDNLLTVRENLTVRGSFYNINKKELKNRIEDVIKTMQLTDFVDRQYGTLSGGQKRRADLARALLNEPEILFLDEPTTGLDPQTRVAVWDKIKQLQDDKNITVFLSTHYMEEAAQSDMVAIIDHGKIVAFDTAEQLRLKYSSDTLKLIPNNINEFNQILQEECKVKNDTCILNVKSSMDALIIIEKYKEHINSFEVVRGTMDDVFINITGREIKGDK